jgi:hypothetical protein
MYDIMEGIKKQEKSMTIDEIALILVPLVSKDNFTI